MDPLRLPRIDARIADTFLVVRFQDSLLVHRLEVMLIVRRAVTDDDLTRVLVWHYNARNRQPTAIRIRVVWHQFLFHHACVLRLPEFIRGCIH